MTQVELIEADFDDETSNVESIPSTWYTDKVTTEGGCQTEPIEKSHARTQHPKLKDSEAQTDPVDIQDTAPAAGLDEKMLESFIDEVSPMLEMQLQRNLNSNAFDGYDVSWEEEHDQVTCQFNLKHKNKFNDQVPDAVTAVAWNATGTIIAAAYGMLDRNDWVQNNPSMLCTWSVMRRNLDPQKADMVVELADCLTCLAFHPERPALLAGGSFNGDVLVFDMSQEEDSLVAKSMLNDYSHQEPVQKVYWHRQLKGDGYVLVSIANDGKVLMWSLANRFRHPVGGYQCIPRRQDGKKQAVTGGGSISFSKEDRSTFVVGLEAGELYKCSLSANEQRPTAVVMANSGDVNWTPAAASLLTRVPAMEYNRLKTRVERNAGIARERDVSVALVYESKPDPKHLFTSPINFTFEPHSGPVYETAFSPFHRNLFLTCSTDSTSRVLHALEPTTSTLFSAAWSTSRPMVFATAAGNGCLYIYDLQRNLGKPEVTLQITSNRSPVYSVAFNPKMPEFVATGDAEGHVKIWRLSYFLSVMRPREQDALEHLASISDEGMILGGMEEEEPEERSYAADEFE